MNENEVKELNGLSAGLRVIAGGLIEYCECLATMTFQLPQSTPSRPLNRATLDGQAIWLADVNCQDTVNPWLLREIEPEQLPLFADCINETCRQAEVVAVKERDDEIVAYIDNKFRYCEVADKSLAKQVLVEVRAFIRKGGVQ